MKIFALLILLGAPVQASTRTLTMEEFLRTATAQDGEFQQILINGLKLKYSQDLALPARDLVLSVAQQAAFVLDRADRDVDTSVSLDKLFPLTGTQIGTSYSVTPADAAIGSGVSQFSASITQPIAENAFGKSTRLLKRITGLENAVARHQIIEAYEDYLATVMGFYVDWHEAYENLQIGRSSYRENSKLLDNMKARRKNRIAYAVDVNKVAVQVMSREEVLRRLETQYETKLNLVKRVMRDDTNSELIPLTPTMTQPSVQDFAAAYEAVRASARTYRILRQLEEKSGLQVKRDANELLPSLDLLLEYNRKGSEAGFAAPENRGIIGISMTWPVTPQQTERASYEVSKIEQRRREIISDNTYYRLRATTQNLLRDLRQQKDLIAIAQRRIDVGNKVLKDESTNYTFAKASLNDYIAAVNNFDSARFAHIERGARRRRLIIEYRRLTDDLVDEQAIAHPQR
jgi:outer membrane protein TolC